MPFTNSKLEAAIESHEVYHGALPLLNEHLHLLGNSDLSKFLSIPLQEIDSHLKARSFLGWINLHSNIQIEVPSSFRGRIVNGTTMSFLDMYLRHSSRKLLALEGEYPFHLNSFKHTDLIYSNQNLSDSNATSSSHFAVLSYPFSADGKSDDLYTSFLNFLRDRDIPTIIDCAMVTLGCPININLENYPNVENITFSFSKSLGIPYSRIGFDFCNYNTGPVNQLNQWSYVNQSSLNLAESLIEITPVNYFIEKYRPMQLAACLELDLEPSPTILFGLSKSERTGFVRSQSISRFCLTPYLQKKANLCL